MIKYATIDASVYVKERLRAAERVEAEAKRVMTSRVQVLPLGVKQGELFEVLNSLGFKIEDMNKVRQIYDNYGGQLICYGIVLFRVSCCNKERQDLFELLGEHSIELSEINWKIKINCFGFCIGCKKEGHIISKCPEKVVVSIVIKLVMKERAVLSSWRKRRNLHVSSADKLVISAENAKTKKLNGIWTLLSILVYLGMTKSSVFMSLIT